MTPTTQYAENATPIHRYKILKSHFTQLFEVVFDKET